MRISSQSEAPDPKVDYLLIGHLTEDRTPEGVTLGGTVSYSGLTADALGHKVGVVTAAAETTDLEPLQNLNLIVKPSPKSTCFQNTYTDEGRVQMVFSEAVGLSPADVPRDWWHTELVHIAPLISELTSAIMDPFTDSFLGLTPQGLMRESDSEGHISALPWENAADFIQQSDATGAGDIFAAIFFSRLLASGDAWTAAETAVRLASASVTRTGLESAPTTAEAEAALQREGS